MGEPVKIMDLAHDLVRLSGRDPETQPMRVVGLRPGEKLHEVLFYDEEDVQPTEVAKLLRAVAEPPPVTVRADVKTLLAMATGGDETALRLALMRLRHRDGRPAGTWNDGRVRRTRSPTPTGTSPRMIAVPMFDPAATPASEASILIG